MLDPAAIADFGHHSGIYGLLHTKYGWPITEIVHFCSIAVLFASVGMLDLRLLGVAKALPVAPLGRLVPFGIGAFGVNAITGFMFFVNAPDQYMYNPAFQLKAMTIAIAGLNVIAFYSLVGKRAHAVGPGEDAPGLAKLIAGVSLLAWLSVIVFGRLITYFRPPWHWCVWC
jgi:hypothetical protein